MRSQLLEPDTLLELEILLLPPRIGIGRISSSPRIIFESLQPES